MEKYQFHATCFAIGFFTITDPQGTDNLSKEDLIIIFSYTGTYFDPNDLRRLHKQLRKAKVWMITGQIVNNPYIDQQIVFNSS